ncbi:MAG TPA: LytTR family DNA-binding domain-containing protein [Gammaproteobacteria bacterium]|nr:LytTR family DNA-binding domain-containing protein [Gammaproteobacteria bacterium]
MIRVVIADDEPHARNKLSQLIRTADDLELLASCSDGKEALAAIRSQRPDLVFLDIQMPELGGFEVLKSLGDKRPYVIFTTAYSEYAAQAFEVEAVDYLLKPFDITRFERALSRARRLLVGDEATPAAAEPNPEFDRLASLLDRRLGKTRLLVKVGNGIRPVDVAGIFYVESEGDYLNVAIAGERLRIRERMKDIEEQVGDTGFVRIHRSVLVNLEHVREMKPKKHGDYEFLMADGARFVSGATYRGNVRRILDQRTHRN